MSHFPRGGVASPALHHSTGVIGLAIEYQNLRGAVHAYNAVLIPRAH
jgi:hypothetical protein